jgi:hypothetical protein
MAPTTGVAWMDWVNAKATAVTLANLIIIFIVWFGLVLRLAHSRRYLLSNGDANPVFEGQKSCKSFIIRAL